MKHQLSSGERMRLVAYLNYIAELIELDLSNGEERSPICKEPTIEITVNSLPQPLLEFCQQVGMDKTVVIEHILVEAYIGIIDRLAEVGGPEKLREKLKSIQEARDG